MCRHYRLRGAAVYVSMLLLALMSGWFSFQALEAQRAESRSMHQALQLTAIDVMERTEYQVWQALVEYDEQKANGAQLTAQQYSFSSKYDQVQTVKNEKRADAMELAAQREDIQANAMWQKVRQTDEERLEILQDLQDEAAKEETLLQQLREMRVHEGLCLWQGVNWICAVVGGLTALQTEVDQTYVQIHQDLQCLAQVDHMEFMEKFVTEALNDKASRYHHMAQELRHTAQLWSQQAAKDQDQTDAWHHTAQALH
jgi:hypothetical protein